MQVYLSESVGGECHLREEALHQERSARVSISDDYRIPRKQWNQTESSLKEWIRFRFSFLPIKFIFFFIIVSIAAERFLPVLFDTDPDSVSKRK